MSTDPSPATQTTSRRDNLHVSDIAAILGKSKRKTKLDVYRSKVGLELDAFGPDIDRGRKFEDIAADAWMKKTGLTAVVDDRPLIHPRLSFLTGHIDRRVEEDRNPLELKCPRVAVFWRYRSEGIDVDQILQGQGYAMLDERPLVHWGLFCADNMEVLPFTIDASPELWPVIESECDRFWNEHVLPGIPPEAVNHFDHENLIIDKIKGDLEVRDDLDFIEAARLMREAALIVEDGEGLLEAQKARIIQLVGGESAYGKWADAKGYVRINRYESRGKPTFDAEGFLKCRPLVLDQVVSWMQSHLRKRLDSTAVEQLVNDCAVNLDEFRSRGKNFPVFRTTYPKGDR